MTREFPTLFSTVISTGLRYGCPASSQTCCYHSRDRFDVLGYEFKKPNASQRRRSPIRRMILDFTVFLLQSDKSQNDVADAAVRIQNLRLLIWESTGIFSGECDLFIFSVGRNAGRSEHECFTVSTMPASF